MSIADNIKFLRKQKNLTQKQLAEKSGLAVITIQQYEAGKYEPKKESLYKLRKALDCNIYEILNKPFESPDVSVDDFEEIEGLDGIMIQKNLPSAAKEKIRQQFLQEAKKAPKLVDRSTGIAVPFANQINFTAPTTTLAPQEAYELLHSLIDREGIDDREREEVSQQLKKILGSYKGLNAIGRKKAVERIEELYMIPKYVFDNFPDNID